jgi:hypothetical protein
MCARVANWFVHAIVIAQHNRDVLEGGLDGYHALEALPSLFESISMLTI